MSQGWWIYHGPDCLHHQCKREARREQRRGMARRPAIPASVREAVVERDGLVCQICGCDVVRRGLSPEADTLHLDHIIPYSHGGTDTEDNLRVSCAACNWARGNRMEKS